MADLANELAAVVQKDPAVGGVVSFVGSTGGNSSENTARMFIQLKPFGDRDASAQQIIQRLRPKVAEVPGVKFFMQAGPGHQCRRPAQQDAVPVHADLDRFGGAQSLGADHRGRTWASCPSLQDVTSDQQIAAPHIAIDIDRDTASRLGLSLSQIDQTLYDAFGQRQVATIYTSSTQYKVVLEVLPEFQTDPTALSRIYVTGAGGAQVPLSTVAKFSNKVAPLTINHQGQFPAVTVSFNLAPGMALGQAVERIQQMQRDLQGADHPRRQLPGHGAGLPVFAVLDAAAGRRGDPRRLHRARHALRELRPPDHHPVGPALGRRRRAAGADGCSATISASSR